MNMIYLIFVWLVQILILFNPLASSTIVSQPILWKLDPNTTTTGTTGSTSDHVSGDLIMLIVMLTMAGLLVICGAVFGIYVLCHRKKSPYEPIA